MIKRWISKFLGGERVIDLRNLLRASADENRILRTEIDRLKAELLGKERLLSKKVAIVDATVGDPEPQGKDRADYVMQVSNFYNGIGKKKLLHLVAITRENLDDVYQDMPPGMDRTRFDDLLRGSSNAFKTLMDWFELLEGEHKHNITPKEDNE